MTYETALEQIGRHMGPAYVRTIKEGHANPFPLVEGELVIGEIDGGSIPDNQTFIIVRRSPKGLTCGQKVGVIFPR